MGDSNVLIISKDQQARQRLSKMYGNNPHKVVNCLTRAYAHKILTENPGKFKEVLLVVPLKKDVVPLKKDKEKAQGERPSSPDISVAEFLGLIKTTIGETQRPRLIVCADASDASLEKEFLNNGADAFIPL